MFTNDRPTQATPSLAIVRINLENLMQVLGCFWKVLAGPKHQADGIHSPDGLRVMTKSMFIRLHCLWQVAHNLSKAPCISCQQRTRRPYRNYGEAYLVATKPPRSAQQVAATANKGQTAALVEEAVPEGLYAAAWPSEGRGDGWEPSLPSSPLGADMDPGRTTVTQGLVEMQNSGTTRSLRPG